MTKAQFIEAMLATGIADEVLKEKKQSRSSGTSNAQNEIRVENGMSENLKKFVEQCEQDENYFANILSERADEIQQTLERTAKYFE